MDRQASTFIKIVFLQTARPFVVHSTNAAALNRLSLMGVEAEYLYLFGNIPWAEALPLEWKQIPQPPTFLWNTL